MRFKTVNELENFKFVETHLQYIEVMGSEFIVVLDNVIISANNSCNRDIRDMRANNLGITISDASIISIIEEGYKIYNADGVLMEENQDIEIDKEKYFDLIKSMEDSWLYSIEKKNSENEGIIYELVVDANEHTYLITVSGTNDRQEWDRFLNI